MRAHGPAPPDYERSVPWGTRENVYFRIKTAGVNYTSEHRSLQVLADPWIEFSDELRALSVVHHPTIFSTVHASEFSVDESTNIGGGGGGGSSSSSGSSNHHEIGADGWEEGHAVKSKSVRGKFSGNSELMDANQQLSCCTFCVNSDVNYVCYPCKCMHACTKCAMRLSTGGKCRQCQAFYVTFRRIDRNERNKEQVNSNDSDGNSVSDDENDGEEKIMRSR